MTSLKAQKEEFVSGMEGTTAAHLLLICSTPVTSILFFQALTRSSSKPSRIGCVAAEVVAFWIPMILCQTIWMYPYGVAYLVGQLVMSVIMMRWKNESGTTRALQPSTNSSSDATDDVLQSRRLAVTVYRSSLMYLTCVAILAVDFHVFPRQHVKTETAGYSLMDLGAASFVVAAGMVSPKARRRRRQMLAVEHSSNTQHSSTKHLRRMLPVVAMGMLRLLTHKELDYQEHVSEYGVHWNFFFTLAFVLTAVSLTDGKPSWIVPTIVLGVYQILLTCFGLQTWVEEAPRSCDNRSSSIPLICDLFVANREGLLGCISYVALYLISEWVAYQFFWQRQRTTRQLWFAVGVFAFIWRTLVDVVGIPVSRRTVNASFCAWVLLVNMLQLAAIHLVVVNSSNNVQPVVLKAVNRHGLVVFVIANLLTGAVNLSINTLEVDNATAVCILGVYMSAVGLVAVLVDKAYRYFPTGDGHKVGEPTNLSKQD